MQSVKQLLKYLKPYTFFAILGPLLMVVEVTMDLLQPTIMQHIIDTGIANQDNQYVLKLGLLMLISAIVGLIGGIGCSIYSSKAAVYFATDIRKDLFHQITHFSSNNKDSFGTGKLLTIMMSDVEMLQRAVMMTLKIFVRGPLLFIGSVVIVFITARPLFPVLLVVVPILIVVMYMFTKVSSSLYQKVQEAIDQVNTKLQENFSGIRVIKAFNRKDHQIKEFTEVNKSLTTNNIRADQVIGILMPVTLFIVNMGIVAALWLGVIKVDNGTLQVGVILAFVNYLTIIMNGLISSSNVLVQIARAFPSADRIHQVLHTKIDIENNKQPYKPQAINGKIAFKNVSFSYSKNGEQVLKNVTFEAEPGEIIGIIGITGSGKSTLVKLIPRLIDCDEGVVEIDEIDIKNYDIQTIRNAIGYVPQKATLFSGSIKENLEYGKENAQIQEISKAIENACASEFVYHFKDGIEHHLTQGATNLSGGQKQRISMARAFVRKPAILVLDDSTSAVDSVSEKMIQKAILTDYKDCTTFIISSKISSIIHADRILVMEDGAIVGQGTHAQLLAENEIYQEIYTTQVGKEPVADERASHR